MPARRVALVDLLAARQPPVPDPLDALSEGRVLVDGAVVTNPASLVRRDARVVVHEPRRPRGVEKLGHFLDSQSVSVAGRTALDVGACTGGFTRALLDRGAVRVFAVDVGYGQLLGSLRQDPRVVNLERTNASAVTPALLGTTVDLIVVDVTYVRLGLIVAELTANLDPPAGAELVGLVKPMFELERGELPTDPEEIAEAGRRAAADAARAGWQVVAVVDSQVVGSGGARELFLHARRP
ncbi:MAG TPA: SAM-dependent methyltransferase [Acidimicrobiales bacterium]|nr:SAM-dependent methyltransferase [Acidimicrobiales bacterium]